MNKLDSITFSANLKEDKNSNYGKKAAYSNGRIYYLSSEGGTQGIYSMNLEGGDIVLEIPVEDIRAISVQPDGIYYAGFATISRNDNGPYRQFRFFLWKPENDKAIDLLKTYTFTDDLQDENVWDFYMADENTSVIRFINVLDGIGNLGLSAVSFHDGKAVPIQQYDWLAKSSISAETDSNQELLTIAQLEHLLFMLENTDYDNISSKERLIGAGSLSVYDIDRNSAALYVDRLLSTESAYIASSFERWFCRVKVSQMILASCQGVDSYDISQEIVSTLVTISPPETIYQQIDYGKYILLLTENLRSTYWKDLFATKYFHQNRALQENLYRLDPETGDMVRLLNIGRNNSFLFTDVNTAVTGGGKTISIYDISGDKAVLLRTIQVEHNIVDRANKVDTAGGWLFLYQFNEQTQRDELIEKVYIGS
ncbi:MAG TPA: hypothetical protein VN538_01110 [Clostridia bacterium]|nr:hypothetical protein [Clostridia bacterium]